jgi:transposase
LARSNVLALWTPVECQKARSAAIDECQRAARAAPDVSSLVGLVGSCTLKRTENAGLSWPLPEDMSDGAFEAALYASRRSKRGHRRIEEPDWASVHRELKRKHVTLLILWDEYIAADPGGYSYSRFCELYRSFEKTLSVTMRQTHAADERRWRR